MLSSIPENYQILVPFDFVVRVVLEVFSRIFSEILMVSLGLTFRVLLFVYYPLPKSQATYNDKRQWYLFLNWLPSKGINTFINKYNVMHLKHKLL